MFAARADHGEELRSPEQSDVEHRPPGQAALDNYEKHHQSDREREQRQCRRRGPASGGDLHEGERQAGQAGRERHQPGHVHRRLSLGSEPFGKLWASHHVHEKTQGRKRFWHPEVGEVALRYDTFRAPGAANHLLVVYTAAPDSAAADALSLLGSLIA